MAEENMTPVSGTEPPPANPLARPRASTLKLKPVIRKPTIGGTGAARPTIKPGMKLPTQAPDKVVSAQSEVGAMEQLKSVTQKLKGVTQQIPQQAILHKTGIIADQDLSEQQKQAAKSRTARISLSDAMGVAPVQNEAAPMKTIRIKRPDAISKAPSAAPAAPAPEPAAEVEPADTGSKATMTQRKTLKISRPGAVRPTGKFGVKKPGEGAAGAEGDAANAQDVADIPDMPANQPKFAAPTIPADAIPDVSKGTNITSIIFQIAACAVIGFLGYCLYQDLNLPLYCGGCGWGQ